MGKTKSDITNFCLECLVQATFYRFCGAMDRLSEDVHRFFTENVINSLQAKGIYTVYDFIRLDNRILIKISPMTFLEINEVKRYLTKTTSAGSANAFTWYQRYIFHCVLIPTRIKKIDNLLQGGIFTGTLYEICGPPASGKTLLCLSVLRNTLAIEKGIYFLDLKQDFTGKRIRSIINKYKSKEESLQLMKNIFVKRITTKYELISALFDIKRELETGSSLKVIVIDSISSLFFNSKDPTENNNILNHFANLLHYIANEYHIAIIVTNLVTSWVDFDSDEPKEKIACGKYWKTIPNIRIQLKRKNKLLEVNLVKYNNVIKLDQKCTIHFNELIM